MSDSPPTQPPTADATPSVGGLTRDEWLFWVRLDLTRRWQRGERCGAEDYLARCDPRWADAETTLEVVSQEILLRALHGEVAAVEAYQRRFPACAALLPRRLDVLRAHAAPLPTAEAATIAPPTAPAEAATLAPAGLAEVTVILDAIPPEWPVLEGYEILGILGRGGMGVVYKARQVKLKRAVALKMMKAGGDAAPEELERFRVEAEAVARLQHPNIVQIHDIGEQADGSPYFSLEYVAGGSLASALDSEPMDAREAAALIETLAWAMDYAHEKGIVHRDLKPANVLIDRDGVPKIADFGLAKRLGERRGQTQTGAIIGTPSYMAPEQAAGKNKEVGPATDVYALGAILYECLTGRPPFEAATHLDTILRVIGDDPVSPRVVNSTVPRDLETICLKCLRKEPPRRYASAADLAEDLRRYLDGRPIKARPLTPLRRLEEWAAQHPVAVICRGLLGAYLLVLIYLSMNYLATIPVALLTMTAAAAARTRAAFIAGVGAVLCVAVGGLVAVNTGELANWVRERKAAPSGLIRPGDFRPVATPTDWLAPFGVQRAPNPYFAIAGVAVLFGCVGVTLFQRRTWAALLLFVASLFFGWLSLFLDNSLYSLLVAAYWGLLAALAARLVAHLFRREPVPALMGTLCGLFFCPCNHFLLWPESTGDVLTLFPWVGALSLVCGAFLGVFFGRRLDEPHGNGPAPSTQRRRSSRRSARPRDD